MTLDVCSPLLVPRSRPPFLGYYMPQLKCAEADQWTMRMNAGWWSRRCNRSEGGTEREANRVYFVALEAEGRRRQIYAEKG